MNDFQAPRSISWVGWRSAVLAVGLGAAAWTVFQIWPSDSRPAPSRERVVEPARLPAPRDGTLALVRTVGNHVSTELDSMKARLDRLEAENDASDDDDPMSDPELRQDAEEAATARVLAGVREALETHERAPRDASWSSEATDRLRTGIEKLGKELASQSSIRDVDCRQDSCVAKLTFPSRDAAVAEHARFVTAYYGVPCATTALLPSAETAGTVEVPFLFTDCKP